MSDDELQQTITFDELGLSDRVMKVLRDVGYESPSPIQAQTIPLLLEGSDVVGLAQTGTGKTAAFALPILSRIDPSQKTPQALVLAPTRELALQVAEAFERYATHVKGCTCCRSTAGRATASSSPRCVAVSTSWSVRRAASWTTSRRARSTSRTCSTSCSTRPTRCSTWASPRTSRRSSRHAGAQAGRAVLGDDAGPDPADREPVPARPGRDHGQEQDRAPSANVAQRYLYVSHQQKLDALTRVLEVENFDGMIVFVRTKQATEDLAERLRARGFSAVAINGDVVQNQRERTIDSLRKGKLDILVATDVAARGLDVERISHVINYDIPTDAEGYVHRIGRTGRAGRSGDAISFVTPREKYLLRSIEKATRQPITEMAKPSVDDVNANRVAKFTEAITKALGDTQLIAVFRGLVESYEQEHDVPASDIAAAIAVLAQDGEPLFIEADPEPDPVAARRARAQGDAARARAER